MADFRNENRDENDEERQNDEERRRLLLGLGLDNEDGHARVTRHEEYVLLGGSAETHDRMQDDVERFRHSLEKLGTDLQRASEEELAEAVRRSGLERRRRERS